LVGLLARRLERHGLCSGGIAYVSIMITTKDGSELIAIEVDPFDWGQSAGGGPSALAWYLFDHDDGEEAGHEALKEMQNVCNWTRGMTAIGE